MEHLQKEEMRRLNLMRKPLEERIKESIIQIENGQTIPAKEVMAKIEKRYGIKR